VACGLTIQPSSGRSLTIVATLRRAADGSLKRGPGVRFLTRPHARRSTLARSGITPPKWNWTSFLGLTVPGMLLLIVARGAAKSAAERRRRAPPRAAWRG
jgi:hypothetical protein